ncbi:MAG: (Fe-S)-binding protein [Dehalococcoidales bacterium]|nr:(Fe-S)-binding protein [Dehalococcoidales bacterium]
MGLEQYQGDMNMCCRCSCCKFIPMQKVMGPQFSYACPSIAKYNFHAYSGGGRLNIASAMLKNGFNYTDKLLHVVYNCQLCGACQVSCNYAMDMEVLEPITEFRFKCVEDGKTSPALDKAVARLRKTGSMLEASGRRGDWAKDLNLKDATKEKVDILYHAGCLSSYDKDAQKLAKTTAQVLQKAGVNFGILGDAEMCCGSRAYQMGYRDDFLKQAEKYMALIRKTGARTLVTGCADGYHAFKVLYDKFNFKKDLEVLHTSELFARLIKEGKLKPRRKVNLAVTYHDPCRLGRLGEPYIHWQGKKIPGDKFVFDPPKPYRRGTNGVYYPPRDVIKSLPGIKFTEMTRIMEYSWCCGAGGGVNESNPEFSIWAAKERVREAIATGAEAIVSTCPWCEQNFSTAIKEMNSSLKVYDIVELVARAI